MKNIRNFSIIAHIDHGKSTLADRLLEATRTLSERDMENQVLDSMDLEREKGITIKSHAIQMEYAKDGQNYILNLIDTPGHVDFSYEVSRAIASCEGALLVVDATQGIQAQTISNLYLAIEHDLTIIPVLNKIDMDSAMVDVVKDQVVELLGCDPDEIILASGKTGQGVDEILDAIVDRIPAPSGDPEAPLQALIFDSVFNSFRGIIAYFKVENGSIRTGDKVKFFNTGREYEADEVGVLKMKLEPRDEIPCGSVGYIISGIKTAAEVKVGDTITHVDRPCTSSIEGFEEVKPMLFAGVYPVEADEYEDLRASLEKLRLNDVLTDFSIALCEAEEFSIADASEGMNKSCSLLRLTDIAIPPNILETVIADMPFFPAGLERAIANAAAKHTLYRNVTLENGTLSFAYGDPTPCRVKRVFSEVAPDMRKGVLQIERLYIPPLLLFGELPNITGMDKLFLDCTWEHTRNNNLSRENVSLAVDDMGHITADLEYTADADILSPDADLQTLLGAQFKKACMRYEDRGGIARILAGQEHPTESLRQLDMLTAQLSALLPDEANKPLIEALRTTLRTPGTLDVRLREGVKITVPELLADIDSIGRKIEVSAVPGRKPSRIKFAVCRLNKNRPLI